MGLGNPEIKRVRNVCRPTHLDQEGKKDSSKVMLVIDLIIYNYVYS